ncbi:MAG TPA: glycerophosphodiester phosphodiesterase [Candidatus Limnocylindria bacterium]|nr:glycerophosphodiester phosphodiesterase [Candidatus Limnocylindria bacterium]
MPRYVAHRGGAARWAENSLTAFRSALAGGATLLELDVHLTADGEVAVIHDPTLDRTSTGRGPLAACTAADLRAARLRDAAGGLTADCVPTLRDVLEVTAPSGTGLLVEIKTPGAAVVYERSGGRVEAVPGARYAGLERKVLDALAEAHCAGRTIVMAFNPAVLEEVRALAPGQATALLVDAHHVQAAGVTPMTVLEWARAAAVTAVGLHHTLCDAALVEAAHEAGILVGVFTVNDADTMRRLERAGVDLIITDDPELIPAGGDR